VNQSTHMDLWNKVSKTDPSHTKKVNQRGGFTAIDAYYQIQNATELFGPVGTGWGWSIVQLHFSDGMIIVELEMWYGSRDTVFNVLGCAELSGKRADSDAPKKALTDAITKGLSYLGFNADVFLGKFDDNKYVQERKAEAKQETKEEAKPEKEINNQDQKIADDLLQEMDNIRDQTALKTFADTHKNTVTTLPGQLKNVLTSRLKKLKASLPEFNDDIPF